MSKGAQTSRWLSQGMLPPRPLLAAALLLVGGLAWSVASVPPAVADLADAARWEGQAITVEGWAQDVRADPTGLRFTLSDGGHAIGVRTPVVAAPAFGDRVQVTGRLGRWQGTLRLDVEDAADLRVVPGGRAATPSWDDLASRPSAWEGTPIVVRGVVEEKRLVDGTHSVALGEGPWPREGPVQARGVLRDDPSCLCRRFDAREVWPWTP